MFSHKLGKSFKRNRVSFPLFLVVILILAFSVSLRLATSGESGVSGAGGMAFEEVVDSGFAKPGDRINFTLSYLNNLAETVYNVTVYEWMPPELAFVNSRPFYDGASEPEIGFYRWSRGRILPSGGGTIVVSASVNEAAVGTEITSTAHLAYEFWNGTRVEVTSSVTVTVTQAAGVDVFPDQIHSVAPHTGARTEYNITVKNAGNALDTFDVILRSVAYNPSGSAHDWRIELFNSTGYSTSPVATVYDENSNDRTSWMDHGIITDTTLGTGESTWFVLRVTEPEGTSGSGDAFLDVHLIARSVFDPNVSDVTSENTIVKSVAGITFAPDYSKEANPGDTVTFSHIIVNSGQSDVIDLSCVSPEGWSYSFFYANGKPLADTDGSGHVDVGLVPRDQYVYVLVKVMVPYNTPAGVVDSAVMKVRGVTSGNSDTVNDATTVRSAPILDISKMLVSENPGYEGDVVTYKVHIVNLGNTKLIAIPLDDTFETAYLDFSSAQPVEDSYDELAGNIHWNSLGVLEPAQSIDVTINFFATEGGQAVREGSNVIDAEDEFGNLVSATCMNAELNLVGAYTLTVTASPGEAVGGTFNVSWTDHGSVKYSAFATPMIIACDEGTTVTISYPESPIDYGDVRHVFVDYLPSAVLLMDSDKTVTLNYRTECVLRFEQAGSSESVYITVDGVQLSGALPQSFWIEKGSVVAFSYPAIITDFAGTTRYVLTKVLGNETNTSVTINAPTVVSGVYKTQFYLSVTTSPEGLCNLQSGWHDGGTYAQLQVEAVTGGDGTTERFRFDHWSGTGIDDTLNASTQILMNAPKTATAVFVKQYYLTVVVSPSDVPEVILGEGWYDEASVVGLAASSLVPVSDGVQYRFDQWVIETTTFTDNRVSFSMDAPVTATGEYVKQFRFVVVSDHDTPEPAAGEHWYDAGSPVTASVTNLADESDGVRYRFLGFVGAGSVPSSGTEASVSFTIMEPSMITWDWFTQYKLTVVSLQGLPSPSVGDYWYDKGTVIAASVASPADESSGTRYRCLGWFGTGSVTNRGYGVSVGFTMIAPSSIEWIWMRQYYLTVSTDPAGLGRPTGEGWYDENAYAPISVRPLAIGDGATTRYRFDNWAGTGVIQAAAASTAIRVDSPKSAQAIFVKQFYLTMSTNFGDVTPRSGWYDSGSTVSIEAFAPAFIMGKGYLWYGWTGTGDGSYSDLDNPAEVVINGAISETAAWKIDPVITLVISNETLANGERIVVYGRTYPAQSGLAVTVLYFSSTGSLFEHTVYTAGGEFTDTLFLSQDDLPRLLVENAEWDVVAIRQDDDRHEYADASASLRVESQSVTQFPPILLAGVVLVGGVIAFVPPARKKKNGNGWRRVAVVLSIAGLISGAVSLLLSWVVVGGTVTSSGVAYRVGVQLYPLSQGVVSISDGMKYVGPRVSSMVQMSSVPVLSLYLIPVACAAALIGLYKPKSVRQKNLKIVILGIAGVLIAASVIHTYLFVQTYTNATEGAIIGYGLGVYVAILSCGLTLVSALFATRENNGNFVETHTNTAGKVPAAFSKMNKRELSQDQSRHKLLELKRGLGKHRGHLLTDKQVNALQALLQGLIDAKARMT